MYNWKLCEHIINSTYMVQNFAKIKHNFLGNFFPDTTFPAHLAAAPSASEKAVETASSARGRLGDTLKQYAFTTGFI